MNRYYDAGQMYQNLIHLSFMRETLVLILFLTSPFFLLSQKHDTIARKHHPYIKNFTAPAVLIGLGLYTKQSGAVLDRFEVNDWRDKTYPHFSNHADDVMQFIPMGLVYGFDLFGVKAKNDLINRTLLLVKTEILLNGVVHLLKENTHVLRPNGTNDHSFPSGHTAQAFAAATFMHKEMRDKSVWYSIGAYTMASTVGVFRILNDKHWISDVLAGAGIGILSTNLVYLTHRYKWGHRPNLVLLPSYSSGLGFYASIKFR